MRSRAFTTIGLLAWGTAAPVLAAGDGGSSNPFAGDLGNSVWTLVTFGLVVFVLGKFAWGPILRGLQDRESFIRKSLEEADAANKQAQAQLAEYTAKLEQAKADATELVEEGRRNAEALKQTIHEQAQKEADALLDRARREIGVARDTAIKDIYNIGATLATDAAGKIIGKELNPGDHERLIQESIAALESTAS